MVRICENAFYRNQNKARSHERWIESLVSAVTAKGCEQLSSVSRNFRPIQINIDVQKIIAYGTSNIKIHDPVTMESRFGSSFFLRFSNPDFDIGKNAFH